MRLSTRRRFLVMTGTAAATVGVAAVASHAIAESTALPASAPAELRSGGPLVAHVKNVHNGSLALMFGEHEVVVRDPDLVARLVRAAS
ncbi:MAG: hypothetical protein ACRDUA_04170 [Micromonosporaceae bacterium]